MPRTHAFLNHAALSYSSCIHPSNSREFLSFFRCGSGDFLSLNGLGLITRCSSMMRRSIRVITHHLRSLDLEQLRSLISQQIAANVDAADRAQIWREKLKSDLSERLSKLHTPPAARATPSTSACDSGRVRAATLGDVYTMEHPLAAHDDATCVTSGQLHSSMEELQRVMRIFFATTNTDAPLERDAVRRRNFVWLTYLITHDNFHDYFTLKTFTLLGLFHSPHICHDITIIADILLCSPGHPSRSSPLRHRSVLHRRTSLSLLSSRNL